MYTLDEIVKAAHKFGVSKALARVALELSGKSNFTPEEAQAIIKNFSQREVKR